MAKWKPEYYEDYYSPVTTEGVPEYLCTFWTNSPPDNARYDAGLVCKTKVEAFRLAEKNAGNCKGVRMLMDLKEFMKKWKVSERDIIEAVKLVNTICRNYTCRNCPLDDDGCLASQCPDVDDFGEVIAKHIQEILHPSKMGKVAELLGVKLGEKFILIDRSGNDIEYVLGRDGLHMTSLAFKDTFPKVLEDLLTGKAYIK